jgi:hypothetical protein
MRARLGDSLTRLRPAWAALCGAIASGALGRNDDDWLRLVLLVLLADGAWGTLWTTLVTTDWSSPLGRWRTWRSEPSVTLPPYARPGSRGDRLLRWLAQLRAWWREVLWPACSSQVSTIAVALLVTTALGVLLGAEVALLCLAVLAIVQLALVARGRRGGTGRVWRTTAPGWDSLVAVAFPWLAGHVAFGPPAPSSAGLALAFALAWSGANRAASAWGRTLELGGQFLAAALLVALRLPLAAAGVCLLLIPQLALLPWLRRGQPVSWYVRHARPWLLVAMLLAAWAL